MIKAGDALVYTQQQLCSSFLDFKVTGQVQTQSKLLKLSCSPISMYIHLIIHQLTLYAGIDVDLHTIVIRIPETASIVCFGWRRIDLFGQTHLRVLMNCSTLALSNKACCNVFEILRMKQINERYLTHFSVPGSSDADPW